MEPDLQRIRQLLQKENWTEAEVQWLQTYLQHNSSSELFSFLREAFENDLSGQCRIDPLISARMREDIFSAINTEEQPAQGGTAPIRAVPLSSGTKGRVFAIGAKQVAAAVVILAVAGLAAWWVTRRAPRPNDALSKVTTSPSVILPGTDKATLRLADGSIVALDSAHPGGPMTQGKARILRQGGKLSYTPAGSAISSTPIAYNTVATPKGGQYQIVLGDGTHVWLDAASSLTFPTSFDGRVRQVEITGEAYFEVARDKDRPFRVSVNHRMQLDVLGTSFNVMAYEEEPAIVTTLVDGSVRLIKDERGALLKPGQQGSIAQGSPGQKSESTGVNGDKDFKISDANVEQALAWKNGQFQFENLSIETIMRQVARWYDVDIGYRDNLHEQVYSGSVSRQDNIVGLLKILEYTGTVHFVIEGRKIIVTQ